jgi:hypothetical protein
VFDWLTRWRLNRLYDDRAALLAEQVESRRVEQLTGVAYPQHACRLARELGRIENTIKRLAARAVAQLEEEEHSGPECDHVYDENGRCFECDSPNPRANLMVRVGGITLVDKLP